MRLAVGLGNPGREYERSRHNLGFHVMERVAQRAGLDGWRSQCEAQVLRGGHGVSPFLLAKPQTYMNLSGKSVVCLLGFYKLPQDDLLVIVDDLDLALGKIRMRAQGSDGGHRGLRDIIRALGSQEFKRIRIGIGRPERGSDVKSYVLGGSEAEQEQLDTAVAQVADLTMAYLESGRFENWSSP